MTCKNLLGQTTGVKPKQVISIRYTVAQNATSYF